MTEPSQTQAKQESKPHKYHEKERHDQHHRRRHLQLPTRRVILTQWLSNELSCIPAWLTRFLVGKFASMQEVSFTTALVALLLSIVPLIPTSIVHGRLHHNPAQSIMEQLRTRCLRFSGPVHIARRLWLASARLPVAVQFLLTLRWGL